MPVRLGHLPLLLAASLIGGCALVPSRPGQFAPPPAAAQAAWERQQTVLAASAGFHLQGRLAVKGEGLSGALRWRQDGSRFELRLVGPFGAGALSLSGDDLLVAIKARDLDLVTTEPEQVLAAQTGWQLPLTALRWWVLGLPAPDSPASIDIDRDGRMQGLRQLGWSLEFSDHRPGFPSLPGRIEARRADWQALLSVQTLTLDPASP